MARDGITRAALRATFACLVLPFGASLLRAQGGTPPISGSGAVATTPRSSVDTRVIDEVLSRPVSINVSRVPLVQAIDAIAASAGVFVQYRRQTIQAYNTPVTLHVTKMALRDVFGRVLAGTALRVVVNSKEQVTIVDDAQGADSTPEARVLVGRVLDSASGRGLQGATVSIRETSATAMTSEQGTFRLTRVPSGLIHLNVRLLGYAAQTDTVRLPDSGPFEHDFVLRRRASVLSDVVTTATQNQVRAEVPVEVSRFNVDAIMATTPIRSVTDLLASRIPGVQVTRGSGDVGSPVRIRINGISSASLTNDPIVILDGIRIAGPNTSPTHDDGSAARMQRMSSPLDDIDPRSLATIEVLHGPAATTLYGTDAANGVIILTSKRGTAGTTRWTAGVTHDWTTVPESYPNIYQGWGHTVTSSTPQTCSLADVGFGLCILDSVATVNPRNNAFTSDRGNGSATQYSVGVSGGSSMATYSLTASRNEATDPEQMMPVDRARARLDNLPIPTDFNTPYGQTATSISTMLSLQPIQTLTLGLTGSVQRQPQWQNSMTSSGLTTTDTLSTTAHLFSQTRSSEDLTASTGGLTANWHVLPQLTVNGTAGMQHTTNVTNGSMLGFQCILRSGCVQTPNASASSDNGTTDIYTANANASLQLPLGPLFTTTTSVVASYRRTNVSDLRVQGLDLPIGVTDISAAGSLYLTNSSNQDATAGLGVEEAIAFRQRMFFTLGLRRDAGSAFGGHIQSPVYPQAGLSWLISEEPFFQPLTGILSDLQLRVAYGQSGVQPDPTMTFPTYSPYPTTVGGQSVFGILYQSVGNSLLQPERSAQLEAGFTATLWTNRLTIDMTASSKRSQNAIVTRTLAASVPYGLQSQNIGAVLNRSLDLSVTATPIDSRDFRWTVVGTANFLRNKVLSLGNATLSNRYSSNVRIVPGYPLFGTWTIPILGVHDNGTGIVQYQDIILGDTTVYLGYSQPRQSFNYSTTVTLPRYGLSLSALLSYDGPTEVLQSQYDGYGLNDPNASLLEQAIATQVATGFWQNVSVLRFNSLQLNWALPTQLAARFRAQSATLVFSGTNLGQWSKYRGSDPSINSLLSTPNFSPDINVDNGSTLPTTRSWSMGLQLGF